MRNIRFGSSENVNTENFRKIKSLPIILEKHFFSNEIDPNKRRQIFPSAYKGKNDYYDINNHEGMRTQLLIEENRQIFPSIYNGKKYSNNVNNVQRKQTQESILKNISSLTPNNFVTRVKKFIRNIIA